jgi:hypothetical protein
MRHGIAHPKQFTVEQWAQGVAACWKLLKEHKDNAKSLRREHLWNRYELPSDLKDPVKLAQIKKIMKREEQSDKWHRIKQVTGDPRTGATNLVQRKEGGNNIDILEEGAMVREIQEVTERQFELANRTPINTSSLRHSVGFYASTEYAKDLLQQKIPIPRKLNEHTIMLIKEMQCLYARLQPLHSPTMVTSAIYRSNWGRINESTLSAWSKMHFRHWKVICRSEELMKLTCTQLNLVAATGTPPSRWGTGLQVLLKKVPGVALVDKLQVILLMEGDFNFFNRWFFGHKAVNKL